MRFTVIWSKQALHELGDLWLKTPESERQALTERVDWVDHDLQENAHQKGALIPGLAPLRLRTPPEFYEPPTVGLLFEVSELDRIVQVLQLRTIPNPP